MDGLDVIALDVIRGFTWALVLVALIKYIFSDK
jgi:hypothetical protein